MKEKDEKVQKIKAELENTQKNLRMLNSGTSNLEQILNMGQSVCNRNGLGYTGVTNDVATTSKIVFVKAAVTSQNHFSSGKIIKPALPKVKRFVPICHYCNKSGHIRPKCLSIKILLG